VREDGMNVSFVWNDTVESVRSLLYSPQSTASGEGRLRGGHRHICYDVCVQYGWMVASDIWMWYDRVASKAGWQLENLDVEQMGACCMQSDDGDGRMSVLANTAAVSIEAG